MMTIPDAKRILVFGDSLVWGYVPGSSHERLAVNVRWTGVLQNILGYGYDVIEEGLNSRGIMNGDPRPGKEGRRALDYLIPCLDTHEPLKLVILMLGTNELKHENQQSAEGVAADLEKLIQIIRTRPTQSGVANPGVVIVVPPVIDETTDYCRAGDKYLGATVKSRQLADAYHTVAEKTGSFIVDVQAGLRVGSDGIHLDAHAHKYLGNMVAATVRQVIL